MTRHDPSYIGTRTNSEGYWWNWYINILSSESIFWNYKIQIGVEVLLFMTCCCCCGCCCCCCWWWCWRWPYDVKHKIENSLLSSAPVILHNLWHLFWSLIYWETIYQVRAEEEISQKLKFNCSSHKSIHQHICKYISNYLFPMYQIYKIYMQYK